MQFIPFVLAGVQTAGAIIGGVEESRQLQYSQRQNEISAMYERDNATMEGRLATADANLQRRRGREAVSEQTVALSQSGFLVNGDASRAIEQSAAEAEMDALTIQYRGVLRSRQSTAQAEAYSAQARADKAARKAVPIKTVVRAATSALSSYGGNRGMRIA